MKNIKRNGMAKIAATSLAIMIAASPLASFAKEKDNHANKAEIKADAKASVVLRKNSEEKDSCLRAFGHLIAPGWISLHGTTTVRTDCWFPFGIAKKFNGSTASTSTSTDVSAPVISSVVSYPRETDARIAWTTNERSDSEVFYATSSASLAAISTSSPSAGKPWMTRNHEITLSGLSASTTYYFKVASKDGSGNVAFSDPMTFTTRPADVVAAYPTISRIAALAGTSTASISWKTNEPATGKLYYGLAGTVDVNSSTASSVATTSLSTNHSLSISGLATSTAYDIVIESRNAAGNATYSNSFSLTTQAGI